METIPFDASLYLTSDEAQVELIAEAIGTGHAGFIARAVDIVARARGLAAEEIGRDERSVPLDSDDETDPHLRMLLRVIGDLGLELKLQVTA